MPFSDPTPTLEMLPGERWRVAAGFNYTLPEAEGNLPAGFVVDVPAGVETDLASIPRILWPLLSPGGDYAPAAIVHDRLYHNHEVRGAPVTRAEADGVLLAGMKELGIGWLTRWTIYSAVRVGAWWAW